MLRFFCFLIFAIFLLPEVSSVSHAANTPVTLPTSDVPETCDEDFWDVIRYKAQMAGQREITQNANMIVRPDSVLELSCFDDHMRHLANYAEDNFPGDPSYSDGRDFGLPIPPRGFFTDIFVVLLRDTVGGIDPWLAGRFGLKGGQMSHILEILVLDSLAESSTFIGQVIDAINLLACSKDYYIEDNGFEGVVLGGRSLVYAGAPNTFNPDPATFSNWPSTVSTSNYSGCAQMNLVWEQVRCDNFQHDNTIAPGNEFSAMHYNDMFHPVNIVTEPVANAAYQISRGEYLDQEIAGNDFRYFKQVCRPETRSGADIALDLFCAAANHGYTIASIGLALIGSSGWSLPPPDPSAPDPIPPWNLNTAAPTIWQELYNRTYLLPGTSGAIEPYQNFYNLLDNTDCNAIIPVRTGLIVRESNTVEYYDAVCPAPGCWYDPPGTLAGTGSCEP